jgi:hypothetical protein
MALNTVSPLENWEEREDREGLSPERSIGGEVSRDVTLGLTHD